MRIRGRRVFPRAGRPEKQCSTLAAALALAALAGCEHGQLSFNRDTGQFNVPIGAGRRETR